MAGKFGGSTWINVTAHMRDGFQDSVRRWASKERRLHVTLNSLINISLEDSGIFMAHHLLQLSLCSDRCRALFSTVIAKYSK